MNRRRFLEAAGASSVAGLAGCLDALGFKERSAYAPPLVENRPDAVYYPTHVEAMTVRQIATDGPYKCAFTYTYPHRFWLVTGDRTNKVSIQPDDSIHAMPIVWHEETGVVPPNANPTIELRHDGEALPSNSPWPMLSQPMGVHFGDNISLPENGTYTGTVTASFTGTKRTGALADAPDRASFDLDFTFLKERRDGLQYRKLDNAGDAGAVEPMTMKKLPNTALPESLPGESVGEKKSGDAVVDVRRIADATRFGGRESETYLAVSLRTPYNRYPLPLTSVSATVDAGGDTAFDGPLTATLDPDLGYHYGASLAADDWSTVEVQFGAPPQIARHEGYETAFLDMPAVSISP